MAVVSDQPIIDSCDVKNLEDRVRRLESTLRRKVLENRALREALFNLRSEKPVVFDGEAAIKLSRALTTRSALHHSMRLATVRAMAASLAHEVSQPLSGISTNADAGARMLALDVPDLAGVAESIKRTMRDATRAAEIIQRLRTMFAEVPLILDPVDINSAINEVVTLIALELERGGAMVQTSLSEKLPAVAGDKTQLQQVILNLLLNAIDAMTSVDDRPRIVRVDTMCTARTGNVVVSIHDVGVGLDKTALEKLFRQFFTTKSTGVGIGLSVCRTIIENHGGRISASANQGEPGACFSFSLPSYHEELERHASSTPSA